MRRTAYILEDYLGADAGGGPSFQVINAQTGRHLSPLFATLLEAIEFFDGLVDCEWNGHIEVRDEMAGARRVLA